MLDIKLLGQPDVSMSGRPVVVDTRKAIALLAYSGRGEVGEQGHVVWSVLGRGFSRAGPGDAATNVVGAERGNRDRPHPG